MPATQLDRETYSLSVGPFRKGFDRFYRQAMVPTIAVIGGLGTALALPNGSAAFGLLMIGAILVALAQQTLP